LVELSQQVKRPVHFKSINRLFSIVNVLVVRDFSIPATRD
jgi:hypothetical protein